MKTLVILFSLQQISTTRESAWAEEKRQLEANVVNLTEQVAKLTTDSTQVKIQV